LPIHEDTATVFEDIPANGYHHLDVEEKKLLLLPFVQNHLPMPGRLAVESLSALNVQLANRSQRNDLMNRFILKRDAKEARDEILGRGAKLGALLVKRPSKKKLQDMLIMKDDEKIGGVQQLEESRKRNKLSAKLHSRPDRGALLKSGILQVEEKKRQRTENP